MAALEDPLALPEPAGCALATGGEAMAGGVAAEGGAGCGKVAAAAVPAGLGPSAVALRSPPPQAVKANGKAKVKVKLATHDRRCRDEIIGDPRSALYVMTFLNEAFQQSF